MMTSDSKNTLFAPSVYCKRVNNSEALLEDISTSNNIEVSDPAKILQLCGNLIERSTKKLEVKINKYVLKLVKGYKLGDKLHKEMQCKSFTGPDTVMLHFPAANEYMLKCETESNAVFLINLLNVSEEAVIQVVNDKILESQIRTSLSEDSIANIVIYKDNAVKCSENLDPKIQALIQEVVPSGSGELVIIPILANERSGNPPKKLILCAVYLVCFVGSPKQSSFISKLVNETFRYCLTLLLNTRECEEERRLKQQCQNLLLVARKLFSHLGDLSDLLKEIMSEARKLTNAERCSLFLLDPDHMHLVAKVFDGVSPAERNTEVRIAKDQGIAGHVAATGQLLNIKNAYKHPLFYKGMDEATGFKTRNILCFPIRDEDNIVGVAQLCNKTGGHFDYFDEQVANAFSIYCGISIMHSLVYKKIHDAQSRSQLSNELMMYHMQVTDQDIADVVLCPNIHDTEGFDDFAFIPRKILHKETPCFVLKMFEDLKLIQHFRIKKETLSKFILYVKKGYRDLPYHNWTHAFSAAHFAYLCVKNFQLIETEYLSELEALAYLVSCLCHDIDHRGTTNAFQQQSNSVLASLYSSEGSVMERHHLSQTLCILNTEGCNFLESLNREDYSRCLDYLKNMILATDLANHFKIHSRQLIMSQDGYDKNNPEHRYYLCSLLMTCADLSDQTKDWPETKKIAQLIYAEFFNQGDMEKKMGREPSNMMDREKASIPDHQLDFLNECCICIFMILAAVFPTAQTLINSIKRNIICWEASKNIFEKLASEGKNSYEVLTSEELEAEVQAQLESQGLL